jgi:endonuclease III
MYGPYKGPKAGRGDALDELVSAVLSQNTSGINSRRGYANLRKRFPTWRQVMEAPVRDVQACITICGLTLRKLRKRPVDEVFAYLTSLYGVGPRTAALVMLFGLGMDVLPVDNGILRVARRLKLVRPKAGDLEAQQVLSPLIEPRQHAATHVLTYTHAKQRCRPRNPKCRECTLLEICPFGMRRVKHQQTELDKVEQTPAFKRFMAKIISSGIRRHGGASEEAADKRGRGSPRASRR